MKYFTHDVIKILKYLYGSDEEESTRLFEQKVKDAKRNINNDIAHHKTTASHSSGPAEAEEEATVDPAAKAKATRSQPSSVLPVSGLNIAPSGPRPSGRGLSMQPLVKTSKQTLSLPYFDNYDDPYVFRNK